MHNYNSQKRREGVDRRSRGIPGSPVAQVRGWRGIGRQASPSLSPGEMGVFGSEVRGHLQRIGFPVFRLRRPHRKMAFVHNCYALKS